MVTTTHQTGQDTEMTTSLSSTHISASTCHPCPCMTKTPVYSKDSKLCCIKKL